MKIKVGLSIGLSGCRIIEEIEVDDEELEGLSDEEKVNHLNEYAKEHADNYVDYWYEEIE